MASLDHAMAIVDEVFSDSYAEAREKFLKLASNIRTFPSVHYGPSGEKLFTDCAYFGPTDAARLVILISATHGPEGYCGSASQLLFLKYGLHEKLPKNTGVLCIHALNAYGFAWDRRVTAEGCDLNRNFVDFSKPLPANPGFEILADAFVPHDLSHESLHQAEALIAQYRKENGERKFLVARSSGQYVLPGNMFYGGSSPTEARCILEKIVADYSVAQRDQVIVIDYHTGLGPYGYGDLMCEEISGIEGYKRAVAIFGPSVSTPYSESSFFVPINGCQDEYWERLLGDRHTYVGLEYGTFSLDRSRELLRRDLWLFRDAPSEVNSELGREIRRDSKFHFYPQDRDWKEMVVVRSHQVHRRCLNSLSER